MSNNLRFFPTGFCKWSTTPAQTISFDELDTLTSKDLLKKSKNTVLTACRNKYRVQLTSIDRMAILEYYHANDKYYHLLFDIDDVKNEADLTDAFAYFNKLSEVLGKYSIGGYTNDVNISEQYNIPLNEDAPKFFSAHVVFYETKASLELISEVFKTIGSEFVNEGIKYQDKSIWSSIINGKGHLMRIAISDKIERVDSNIIVKPRSGCVFDKDGNQLPNSTNIIAVKGNERELTKEDMIACGIVFKEAKQLGSNMVRHSYQRLSSKQKVINTESIEKVELDKGLVAMDYTELALLLENIHDKNNDNNLELLKKVVGNLGHAGHVFKNKDALIQVVDRWYNNVDESHNNPDAASQFMSQYYYEENAEDTNNKWFYSLMKLITDEQVVKDMKKKYAYKCSICDYNINENTGLFIEDIIKKHYSISQDVDEENKEITIKIDGLYELINDLKQCVGFCNGFYYVFSRKGLTYMSRQMLIDTLIYKPFGNNVNIRLSDIIYRFSNHFMYLGEDFAKTVDGNTINIFRGYAVKDIENEEGEKLLKRIIEVLCNNDIDVINHFTSWLSWTLNHPESKPEVAYVFKSLEGAGKGSLVKVLEKIFEGYIAPNITDIEDITGKYNQPIQNKKLVIGNEIRNFGEGRNANMDSLKSAITEKYMYFGDKNVRKHLGLCMAAFIFFTNNTYPIRVSADDRRFVVCECSSELKGKFDFWNNFYAKIEDDNIINGMFHYLLHFNDDKPTYNPRILPITEAKMDLIDCSISPVEQVIIDNYEKFCEGIPREQLMCYKPSTFKSDKFFRLEMKKYLKDYKPKRDGKQVNLYKLKDEIKDKYNPDRNQVLEALKKEYKERISVETNAKTISEPEITDASEFM